MSKNSLRLSYFALLVSFLNLCFFHIPFFKFVFNNIEYKTFNGIATIISLVIIMLMANYFTYYIILFVSRFVGKLLLVLSFIINSIAVYFINTYSVIIDETMISNILNTNYEESSSFFSFKLLLYIILLGIFPSIYIIGTKIANVRFKKFLINASLTFLFMLILVFSNSSNWLWIDKNSKKLGGLAMPWNYTVNASLFYIHEYKKNEKEILLPTAKIKNSEKSVIVLVIGESARSQNFSLYGYNKNTNPLLSNTVNLFAFNAISCATYTTAGVKCILQHKDTKDLYEILPNYLNRNNVEVIWRTTNWGEPPLHIKNYQTKEILASMCKSGESNYDEVLLTGLKEQIRASKKNKILIILHTSTSHGPTYNKKYPARFEIFKPVCNSVELGNCSKDELINAYDNTIIYTDYILYNIIQDLKQLNEYKAAMLYVSDHGESLGENNLYMHGVPMGFAPKEQYTIPFIVWVSDTSKQLKSKNKFLSQAYVFHSVLNFLDIESPVYDEEMNIFK